MTLLAQDIAPQAGEIVKVRSRRYLVEGVVPPPSGGDRTLVRLSCLEEDSEGEPLEVLWEKELDAKRMNEADWSRLAKAEFDAPIPAHWLRVADVTSTSIN